MSTTGLIWTCRVQRPYRMLIVVRRYECNCPAQPWSSKRARKVAKNNRSSSVQFASMSAAAREIIAMQQASFACNLSWYYSALYFSSSTDLLSDLDFRTCRNPSSVDELYFLLALFARSTTVSSRTRVGNHWHWDTHPECQIICNSLNRIHLHYSLTTRMNSSFSFIENKYAVWNNK